MRFRVHCPPLLSTCLTRPERSEADDSPPQTANPTVPSAQRQRRAQASQGSGPPQQPRDRLVALSTAGRQRAAAAFGLPVRKPPIARKASGEPYPDVAVLPPRSQLSAREAEVAEYTLGALLYGDEISVPEQHWLLQDNDAMHEAFGNFRYVPSNLTTTMQAQNMEGAYRSLASRDSKKAVLRLPSEPDTLSSSLAINRISEAGACSDVTAESLYARLKTLNDDFTRLHHVRHREADHQWTERWGEGRRTAIDLWLFRVFQIRHGEFTHDRSQVKSRRDYGKADLPRLEREIEKEVERLQPRIAPFKRRVAQLHQEQYPLVGETPMSALERFFTATIADNLTHLAMDDLLNAVRKTEEAEASGRPFDPEDKDDARHPDNRISLSAELRELFERLVAGRGRSELLINHKNLIAGAHAARKIREASRFGREDDASAPPPLSIRDACREAPKLVEGAKRLAEPHDWTGAAASSPGAAPLDVVQR